MAIIKANYLKQGLLALTAVAVVGSTTAVYAAVNNSDKSSDITNDKISDNTTYAISSTSEEATSAAALFAQSINTSSDEFQSDVAVLSDVAKTRLADGSTVDDFDAMFASATSGNDAELNGAFDGFITNVQSAANTAESKDAFIDQFNRAKADYFNTLDQAKNDFAAAVSPLGDNANQAKDAFIGGYNTTRDNYGNELEAHKNKFADTISNL